MKKSLLLLAIPAMLSASCMAQRKNIVPSCPDVFETHKGGETQAFRYASSARLNRTDTAVRTLLIFVHGLHRNAMGYFASAEDAVHSAGQKKTTLVIAPQYAVEEDLYDNGLGNRFLYWKRAEWKDGWTSVTGDHRGHNIGMSSYELMDSLITFVLTSGKFPHIDKVVIAGHSAGGQFVQRYSAITPLPDLLPSFKFRFIVMNPSSYMYPDNRRPGGDGTFVVPDSTGCPAYDRYPKGLSELSTYAGATGADRIRHNMLQRDIVILLGADDTDIDDPDLDVSCAANLQGNVRLARGLNFFSYISSFPEYGQKQYCNIVPRVGHSGKDIINSKEARKWIFDTP